MGAQETREKFLEVFRREWDMFVNGGLAIEPRNVEVREGGEYNVPVTAGEVRVFATKGRAVVGALYKAWGADGWVVIPVSEFSVPATEQEILIGARVYQLWNSFTAPASFVEKSWLVDVLGEQDLKDLEEALLHVLVGDPLSEALCACTGVKITSPDDARLDYERTFAVHLDSTVLDTRTARGVERRVFGVPFEFLRQAVDSLPGYRYAAETEADEPKSFMVFVKGPETTSEEVRRHCAECVVATEFRPICPGGKPYTLVFDGPDVPPEYVRRLRVKALNRTTLNVVGEGFFDPEQKEIVVTTLAIDDAEDAVMKPDQLVLVMAQEEDHEAAH